MENISSGFYDNPQNKELEKRMRDLLSKGEIDFTQILNEAQKLTISDASRKPSHYKQRNFMAENMYGNMIGLLFDNYPGYLRRDKHKRPFVKFENDIRIYLKKLTPKSYLPSNIETDYVKKLKCQELFTPESSRINVLFAGYVLKEDDWFIPFEECCISYINRFFIDQVAWTIDLKEYKKQAIISTPTIITENNENLVTVSPIVIPKISEK
jgi:hypothetical protein